jgi:glutaredoxin
MSGPVFLGIYRKILPWVALALGACSCGNKLPEELRKEQKPAAGEFQEPAGEPIKPPFAVRGEAEGLLLVWFDEQGLHTALKRSEIPAEQRQHVRVDSLQIPPDKRLDQDYVYVADLRQAAADGSYPVSKLRRDRFDSLVDGVPGPPAEEQESVAADEPGPPAAAAGAAGADVILYSASWCGACRAARNYLKKNRIAFLEKDIEKDRDGYAEMQRKARAAGITPGALPMMEIKGKLVSGFDPKTVQRLLGR